MKNITGQNLRLGKMRQMYFYDNIRLPIYHTRKYDIITLSCFR